ncbi:MAG TPA: ABC transporter permease, partial [Spirochaetota bacterium]|nr:ABC transporter permease [Spirochaetota bacterium]
MSTIRQAFFNVIRHKWSSLVLGMIVAVSVFVLYWAFGIANTFLVTVKDDELKNNGHLAYETSFISNDKIGRIRSVVGVVDVRGERFVRGFVNSKKKNGIVLVTDINEINAGRIGKYKIEGRLPEKSDEIAISTEYDEESLEIGDAAYVTTLTPAKIVNTVKYRVVGKGKIGECSVVSADSMRILLNSDDFYNRIVVTADRRISEKELAPLDKRIRKELISSAVTIDESTNYFERMRESEVIILVFNALKIILLCVMFPLCGASLGALVWIHAYKRRGELWTCSAIGYRDAQIIRMMIVEYLIIAAGGVIAGSVIGLISSQISSAI